MKFKILLTVGALCATYVAAAQQPYNIEEAQKILVANGGVSLSVCRDGKYFYFDPEQKLYLQKKDFIEKYGRPAMRELDYLETMRQEQQVKEESESESDHRDPAESHISDNIHILPVNDKGEIVFTKVVQEEGQSAADIYDAVKVALADTFNSAPDVIKLDNPDTGVIIIKGTFIGESFYVPITILGVALGGEVGTLPRATYTFKIQIRAGKYKMDIYDIIYHSDGIHGLSGYAPPMDWRAEQLLYRDPIYDKAKPKKWELFSMRLWNYQRECLVDNCNGIISQIADLTHKNLTAGQGDGEDW